MKTQKIKKLTSLGKRLQKYQPGWLARETGVSIQTISNWKYGITSPTLDQLKKLSNATGISIEKLIH